jgi:hypothetical protein
MIQAPKEASEYWVRIRHVSRLAAAHCNVRCTLFALTAGPVGVEVGSLARSRPPWALSSRDPQGPLGDLTFLFEPTVRARRGHSGAIAACGSCGIDRGWALSACVTFIVVRESHANNGSDKHLIVCPDSKYEIHNSQADGKTFITRDRMKYMPAYIILQRGRPIRRGISPDE